MMTSAFLKILSMSLTASYCILFVCVARILLKKAPKIFSYLLWSVVAFRLICPFSFESMFSLVGESFLPSINYDINDNHFSDAEETHDTDIKNANATALNQPYSSVYNDNTYSNNVHSNNVYSENVYDENIYGVFTENGLPEMNGEALYPHTQIQFDMQRLLLRIFAHIWGIIACILAGYALFTYVRLKQKLKIYAHKTSSYHSIDVWQVAGLDTPFVLGTFYPSIYLPENLTEEDITQCLSHEYTHIRRKDYLIKQFAYLLVCIYWFNPLVWLAFYLMTKDMEMSCDEVAIKSTSLEDRKAYSGTLLELSSTTKYFSGCPLAFGANNTKARIKHIMNYKRPSFWVMVLAVVLVIVCIVGLSTNPQSGETIVVDSEANSSVLDESTSDLNIPMDNPNTAQNTSKKLSDTSVSNSISSQINSTTGNNIKDYYTQLILYREKIQEIEAELSATNKQKEALAKELEALQGTEIEMEMELQLHIAEYEAERNILQEEKALIEAKRDLISEKISLIQCSPLYYQLQGPQYRLFAQIDVPETNEQEDYIVLAYDSYSAIDDSYSYKSMPEAAHSSSVMTKLHAGDFVEVLQYGYLSNISEELTSQYALICWEPANPAPENCGYVKVDYLNINVPENSLAAYLLAAGNYWANYNLVIGKEESSFLPIYHVNIINSNEIVITYYQQINDEVINNYKQKLTLNVTTNTLEKMQSLSELCCTAVSTEAIAAYGEISSFKEFQTVYGGAGQPYSIYDFEGSGLVLEIMENSKVTANYADPVTALENYLHLKDGKGLIIREESSDHVTVYYQFPDGYAAIIPMHKITEKKDFWCIDYEELCTYDIWGDIAIKISEGIEEHNEILNKFTEYLNQPENNAFVTTSYTDTKVDLKMLLYDAGAMLDNAQITDAELELLARENINEQKIMYHFTGEQIDSLLQDKMNLSLEEIKYSNEIANTLKTEWIYLEEYDTYTLPAKGDSKLQDIKCTEIRMHYTGELIIEYEAKKHTDFIKSGQLIMKPGTTNSRLDNPDDFYFYQNLFTNGGYVDNI